MLFSKKAIVIIFEEIQGDAKKTWDAFWRYDPANELDWFW